MIKAVFFDVDDTMYDHLIPFQHAISDVVSDRLDFPFAQAYHRMRYFSDKLSVEYGGAEFMEKSGMDKKMQAERFQLSLAEFDINVTLQQAQQIQYLYHSTQFNISTFSNMDNLITRLKQSNYIVGLLTNGVVGHQWKKIKALNLHQLINEELIFISGAYGIDKPNPDIFKLISTKINVEEDKCLYVGDSWRNDVIGALNANWQVIWFNHRQVVLPDNELKLSNMLEVNRLEQLYQYFEKNM